MEDRVTHRRAGPPGLALIALVAIVVITTAWWGLALWPVGPTEPEWLARTRAACFGAAPGGLPDAGGWILLVGEPLGMAALLVAIWRRSLVREFRELLSHPVWRLAGAAFALVVIATFGILGQHVARAYDSSRAPAEQIGGVRTRLHVPAPVVSLIDQHGDHISFGDCRGQTTLVTFAFGHCTTVCPTVVRDVMEARRAARRPDVRLVVVTLDPWRDTPDRLPSLAVHWEMAPGDRVLSGAVSDVEAALDALGIGRRRNDTNGSLEHGSTVMLLDARGELAWRIDGWPGGVRDLLARRVD